VSFDGTQLNYSSGVPKYKELRLGIDDIDFMVNAFTPGDS